jgi:FkbM family methyltransferase
MIKRIIRQVIKNVASTKLSKYILRLLPNNQINVLIFPEKKPNKAFVYLFLMLARYNKLNNSIYRDTKFIFIHEFSMNLDIKEYTQCSYYLNFLDFEFISEIKLGGGVFLDIGANVGIFSLIASQAFDEVIAFEPHPETYKTLTNNIESNLYKNITTHNIGLSNQDATMELYVNPLNNGGASLNKFNQKITQEGVDYNWDKVDVKVRTLDDISLEFKSILKNKRIDLIKIDVEGHELLVLKGALNVITTYMPVIYAEVAKDYSKVMDILTILPESYFAYSLINKTYIDKNSITNIPNDILFVPNHDK